MDCKIFEVLIHDYIDQRDMLSKDEIIEIEKHLNECETCKNYYIEMKKIMSIIKEDSQIDLEFPDDLHESIMNEVKKEYKKPLRINKWIPIIGSCAAVFLIAMVVKIGSGDKSYDLKQSFTENTVMEYAEEAGADMLLMDEDFETRGAEANSYGEEKSLMKAQTQTVEVVSSEIKRKLIMRADLGLITENYDLLKNKIENLVNEKEGFIEQNNTDVNNYSGIKLKNGFMRVRIPSREFDNFINQIEVNEEVSYLRKSGEDITKQYYDTENRAINLEIQERRLRELMVKAEKIEDLLQIESELTRLRTNIDALRGNLKNWDQQVDFATININLEEVEQLKPKVKAVDKNLWQKSKEGFINTVNRITGFIGSFVIAVISFSPIIIGILIIALIAIIIIRKNIKK